MHDKVDDVDVGKHPLVARLLKVPFIQDLHFLVILVLGMFSSGAKYYAAVR